MSHPREPQKVYRLFLGGGLHGRQLLIAENETVWQHQHPNIPIPLSAGPLYNLDITGLRTYTYEIQTYRLAFVYVDAHKDKRIIFFALEGIDPVATYREYRPARLNQVRLEALNFLDGRAVGAHAHLELCEWIKDKRLDQEERQAALGAAHIAIEFAIENKIIVFDNGMAEFLYVKAMQQMREKNPTPQ